jgi:competence protein ComEC
MSWKKVNCAPNIFLLFLICFLCGIVFCCFFDLKTINLQLYFLVAFFVLFSILDRRKWIFLFFCFLGFGLGFRRAEMHIQKIDEIQSYEFSGRAVVSRAAEVREDYQVLVLRKEEDQKNFNWRSDEFQVFTEPQIRYRYGDILQISCQMQKPENKYDNFDYQRFLASKKIFQVCNSAKIEKTNENKGNFVLRSVFSLREVCENKINQLLPLPESAYLAGLLLGGSERLPSEVSDQFQKTGMTHTVAASGYNITILASALIFLAILFGMWRQHAFWLALVGIVFFVLMIGAPSSAVRASVMGGLVLWAAKEGRLANSLRAIVFAAALMGLNAPMMPVYDVGFQLSFLATVGIVTVYGPLAEKFSVRNDFLELKSILLVTISAQLGVLGILIYSFESFSPISFVANLAILPFIPYIMFGGVLIISLGIIFPFLAKIVSALVWLALHLEIKAVEMLSQISWASVPIRKPHWSWLLGYYIFFTLLVLRLKKRENSQEF